MIDTIYLKKNIMFEYVYSIDNPTHAYKVSDEPTCDGYFYAIIYHPSFMDIKLLKHEDCGVSWFYTKEACVDARIAIAERRLKLEVDWKNRNS